MEVFSDRCCGIDVHKKSVVACVIVPGSGKLSRTTRTFGTTTAQLRNLLHWLREAGCTHVAMESTGVYWKPVYNVLDGHFEEILVVNAQHLKAVPGRKTDVCDAEWIANLLRHGLLRGSFIPSQAQRDLRGLTRHRTTLVRERARVLNRLHKVLEEANIKLGLVVSQIHGVSAQRILRAIASGEQDPNKLAALADGRLRAKPEDLAEAVDGLPTGYHRFLLKQLLSHMAYLDSAIAAVSAEIHTRMEPLRSEIGLLEGIPGISQRIAEVILAEIGSDMSRFPSAAHLASWAGMCPGNNESAGKRRSGKTRKGSPWLRSILVEAAHSATRKKGSYLKAQYHRLAARRGKKRALVAVGHTILVIIYHMLSNGEPYRDLGDNYFDELSRQRVERQLIRRLEKLGFHVTLEPAAA